MKSAELQNPTFVAISRAVCATMPIQSKFICFQTKSMPCMMQWVSYEIEPLLLTRFSTFGIKSVWAVTKLMRMNTDNTLNILFML